MLDQINALAIRLKQPGKEPFNGRGGIPAAERAVLEIVHRSGALTVPQIARERSTSRQNIQILVDRLRAAGRVEMVENPAHKRSGLVQLTEAGTKWFSTHEPRYRDFLSNIEAELARNEVEAGLSVLRKLHELCSQTGTSPAEQQSEKQPKPRLKRTVEPVKAPAQARETGGDGEEEFPVNLL